MWKYHIEFIEGKHFKNIEEKLNELGSKGWEAIYCDLTKPEKFGDSWKLDVILKIPDVKK